MKYKIIIPLIIVLILTSVSAIDLSDIDFNGDNLININDLRELSNDFGKISGFDVRFDVNQDGEVDLIDLVTVAINIGQTYEPNIISLNKNVYASSSSPGNDPENAVDGDTSTSWNSGDFPVQWIEIDLENYYNINEIRLLVNQFPDGETVHKIYAGQNSNPQTLVKTFLGDTSMNEWLEHTFLLELEQVRFIRIVTEESPSWVGWKEIEVYGSQAEEPIYNIFDNGLYHRCVRAAAPTALAMDPVFEDLSDCMDNDPIFHNHSWNLGFHSERDYGDHCLDFLTINQNSPVSFEWLDRGDGSITAHLKQDYINYQHPCGANHFNWYILGNYNAVGNKPYPKPKDLVTEFTLFYNSNEINGASRLIVGISGFKVSEQSPDALPYGIELGLHIDNWGDAFPDSPVIAAPCDLATCNSEFVFIDGNYFGYNINENEETVLRVEWGEIFQYLIDDGWLVPPLSYTDTHLSTASVLVGFELNNLAETNANMGELFVTGFKIMKK